MVDSKYHVGDRVRVRDWDDMASESRDHNEVYINVGGCTFVRDMRHLCGFEFVIENVLRMGGTFHYGVGIEEFKTKPGGNYWLITEGMIEPVPDMEDDMVPAGDLMSILTVP